MDLALRDQAPDERARVVKRTPSSIIHVELELFTTREVSLSYSSTSMCSTSVSPLLNACTIRSPINKVFEHSLYAILATLVFQPDAIPAFA
jgi:hypothetical protein